VEEQKQLAREIISALGIAQFVRTIVVEKGDSPWSEKALIKWKKDHLDVKAFIWDDPTYLYGRIYRLFLYVVDVLNPAFEYRPRISPDEEKEPNVRDRYNHIWSIYVDSRMERRRIENFYDRSLRRNIFVDSEKELSHDAAGTIFDALWAKESFTYPEIIDYSYDVRKIPLRTSLIPVSGPDQSIGEPLREPSVRQHLERIPTPSFRETVNDIISFTAYQCKDAYIQPKYFGICLLYQRQTFLEMIPTGKDSLYLTIFDAKKNAYETQTITDKTDIQALQDLIKKNYHDLALQNEH